MQLTREEQLRISKAAIEMAKAFSLLGLAENRLNIANNLSCNLVEIRVPDSVLETVLKPYKEQFMEAHKRFFESLGIGDDNKEFWDWAKQQCSAMSEVKAQGDR